MRTRRIHATHPVGMTVPWIVMQGSMGANPLPGIRVGVDETKDGCGIRDGMKFVRPYPGEWTGGCRAGGWARSETGSCGLRSEGELTGRRPGKNHA